MENGNDQRGVGNTTASPEVLKAAGRIVARAMEFEDDLPQRIASDWQAAAESICRSASVNGPVATQIYNLLRNQAAILDNKSLPPMVRVDFRLMPDGKTWMVKKHYQGLLGVRAVEEEINVEAVLQWFEENRWTVRRCGSTFFRAWFGQMEPVRTTGQMLRMRGELAQFMACGKRPAWLPDDVEAVSLDLKFDL